MFGRLFTAFAIMILPAAAVAADDHSAAREEFARLCAACHGTSAKGNGPAAASLKVAPADLTSIARRNGGIFPHDRVFDAIVGFDRPMAHGSSQMPVWGDLFIDEAIEDSVDLEDVKRATRETGDRIGALVDYIKSLQEP